MWRLLHVCKHPSPCDVTTSWCHIDNCNSMRFTVRKLPISGTDSNEFCSWYLSCNWDSKLVFILRIFIYHKQLDLWQIHQIMFKIKIHRILFNDQVYLLWFGNLIYTISFQCIFFNESSYLEILMITYFLKHKSQSNSDRWVWIK